MYIGEHINNIFGEVAYDECRRCGSGLRLDNRGSAVLRHLVINPAADDVYRVIRTGAARHRTDTRRVI